MQLIENSIIRCRGCDRMLIINEKDIKKFLENSEIIINKVCNNCSSTEKIVIRKAFFIVDYVEK